MKKANGVNFLLDRRKQVALTRRMKQANPIAVRPRKDSDLEKIWESEGRSNKAMGEHFHSWAEQFARMTREEDHG